MKKAMKPVLVLAAASFMFTSCMGSFVLTKKVYNWNEGASSNRYVNNLVFWLLASIQVYSATLFIDGAILNLIEFWKGSNPLAFAPDYEGTDRLAYNGKVYELESRIGKLVIRELDGETLLAMEKATDGTWMALNGAEKRPMFREDGDRVTFYQGSIAIEMEQANVQPASPFSQHSTAAWASR